jgi:hypothetical protein
MVGCLVAVAGLVGCRSEQKGPTAGEPAQPQVIVVQAAPATQPVVVPRYVPATGPAEQGGDREAAGHRSIEELNQPPVGATVRVQFRRDAMGLAGTSAIGPDMQGLVARTVQVVGKVERITPEWVVVRVEGKAYWISRSVILFIEVL